MMMVMVVGKKLEKKKSMKKALRGRTRRKRKGRHVSYWAQQNNRGGRGEKNGTK